MRLVERPAIGRKLAVSALLGAVCVTLVHLAPEPRPQYKMADEVVEHLSDLEGEHLRVHGYVEAGTIVRLADDVNEYVIQRKGLRLRVRHAGVLPDTFHDLSEVVQDGTLRRTARGYELDGDAMFTKCGGKYDGATPYRTTRFE